jgi:hypothetical protein
LLPNRGSIGKLVRAAMTLTQGAARKLEIQETGGFKTP